MLKTQPVLLVVAAALVDDQGRVLVQRRPAGKADAGLWEFPGGKVEPGESLEAALAREVAEELAVGIDPDALIPAGFASVARPAGPLVLLCFAARRWTGEPRALAADALAWIAPADMGALAMPPADRPIVEALLRMG